MFTTLDVLTLCDYIKSFQLQMAQQGVNNMWTNTNLIEKWTWDTHTHIHREGTQLNHYIFNKIWGQL